MTFILMLLISSVTWADFPKNDLWIPPSPQAQGIAESDFNRAIESAHQAYSGEVLLKAGCTLKIEGNWSDGTVNAFASRYGSTCLVSMFGGFARYGEMNYASFLGVVCHEIGHHIGGRPRYGDTRWASCEGQSDYWGTSCLKRLVGHAEAKRGALILTRSLAQMSGERTPRFSTPDPRRVTTTYCGHPRAQCRLDTMAAKLSGGARPQCWYAK